MTAKRMMVVGGSLGTETAAASSYVKEVLELIAAPFRAVCNLHPNANPKSSSHGILAGSNFSKLLTSRQES